MISSFLFALTIGCQENQSETPAAQTPNKKDAAPQAKEDFNPCALEKVRACLQDKNSKIHTCDAHRGYFGVLNPMMKNEKFVKGSKDSCTIGTFIEEGLCPTENVFATYVTWMIEKKGSSKHNQIGYQVVYDVSKEKKGIDQKSLSVMEMHFTMQAKNPMYRTFKCDADGKMVKEF